ncbi:MAG: cellulase family glycosylhydrolase [Spirochaetota bacterium]|mgnify:CR=1 FL=1
MKLSAACIIIASCIGSAAAAQPKGVALGMHTVEYGGGSEKARAATVAKIVKTGAAFVRINILWRNIQPTGADHYASNFVAVYDDYIDKLARAKLDIIAISTITPKWASSGTILRKGNDVPSNVPAPAAFAQWMSWLAARYKDKVSAFQFYNEVDIPNNWDNGGAESYMAVHIAGYNAVKAVGPDLLVVTPGISWEYGRSAAFVKSMYAFGLHGNYDVMALHLYPIPSHDLIAYVKAVTDIMDANDDTSIPLWVTETGLPTMTKPTYAQTEEQQVEFWDKRVLRDMRGLMPRIRRITWYELEDHGLPVSASWTAADNKAEPEFNFGVYRSDGSGKLILQRMQNYDPTDRTIAPAAR